MKQFIKALCILSLVLLFAFGIALIMISYLPLDKAKAICDSFTADGNLESFSITIVKKLKITGIVICIVTGFVFSIRRHMLSYISNIFTLISYFNKNLIEAIKKENNIHRYAFALIILAAIAIRIFYVFKQPFMLDESRVFFKYVYDVASGVKGILAPITQFDEPGNHIFHTLSVYITYKFFGSEQWPWIMRLPALFAGILIIPASYMAIRIFYNKNAALLTSAIVASSSQLISYSADARGYTILCLLFLLTLSLGKYIKDNNDLAGWHLFAILSAISFYTVLSTIYSYGIIITWLTLSIIFKDINHKRSQLLRNLFLSIALTITLTIILYSPVILFGTGLESIISPYNKIDHTFALLKMPKHLYIIFIDVVSLWTKSVPIIIKYLLIVGFISSIIFHKKLSNHRIPLVLAVLIGLISLFLVQKMACHYERCWLFMLPLCIGLASCGIIYLFKIFEPILTKHKTAVIAVFATTLSFVLLVNTVHIELPQNSSQRNSIRAFNPIDDIDNYGEYINFQYIIVSIYTYFFRSYDKTRILVLFPSLLKTEFWNERLQYYYSKSKYSYLIITDLKSYLSNDSSDGFDLLIISSKSVHVVEDLLEKKGIPVSNYNAPQLICRYKDANLYKMDKTTSAPF